MQTTIYLHSDGHAAVSLDQGGAVVLDLSTGEFGSPQVVLFFDTLDAARDWLAKVTDGIERLGGQTVPGAANDAQ